MLIDLDRCVRCDECVVACARAHDNNPRFNRHGRRHDHYMVANACMHCMDPVCMIGCPTGAIHRSSAGGQVVINDLTCIGCSTCANSCPYDNIRMVEARDSTRWVLAVVAGLLVLVLASGYRTAFINPGELSFQHSALADCGSCHVEYHKGVVGWMRAAWSQDNALEDSKPCITCHKMTDRGLLPHNLPAADLQALSANVAPATVSGRSVGVQLANLLFSKSEESDERVPCMTCHREHQGAAGDLTRVSDDHCNTCHQVQFHSLASGHPDFARYPYERRTQIQFDHTSHIDKHFRDAKMAELAPHACRDCHKTDSNDRLMEVKPFEASCGACHGEQVAGAGRASAKGMAVFAVPGLDVASLRETGTAIGEWPEYADGAMPPIMNLLLSADPDYRAANTVFNGIDDPMDLSEANGEQLAAVETLAWGVKSLLFDLRTKGVVALHARLQRLLGRPLSAAETSPLTALLPLDTIAAAQKEWFPSLESEIPRWRDGELVSIPSDEVPDAAGEVNNKGEAPDQKDADGDSDGEIDTGKDDDDDEIATDDDDDEDEDEDEDEDDEIATGKDDDDDDDDDEIDTDKDNDDDEEIATDNDDDDDGKSAADGDHAAAPVIAVASGEDWNVSGGWYRDEFVLRYRPTGHEDGFIRAWLDLTGKTAQRLMESSRVFEGLIGDRAPGLCGKCHSVNKRADGGLMVNWHPYEPEEGLKKPVRFSHAAHFNLMDERGCLTCHV